MPAQRPVLYLIDGHSLAYRAHYSMGNRDHLTNSKGEITTGIFVFARYIMEFLSKDKPKYIAVAFDDGLSGRDVIYSGYKAQRDEMPSELSSQIPTIMRLVDAFNIPCLMLPGYEADDVIGTISAQAEAQGINVRIVTGDGDMLQLLSPHTDVRQRVRRKVGMAFKTFDIPYDEAAFRTEYGFEPRQLIDYKALRGDTSDNIPGVAGIGEKGATELIQQYGSVEGIYEHIDETKGSLQKKLVEGRESAFLSKLLATIKRDIPLELNLKECMADDFDRSKVEALFTEMEFTSLFSQLDKLAQQSAKQLTLFERDQMDEIEKEVEALVDAVMVQDEAALAALVDVLESADAITFDVETTGTDQMACDLIGIALSVNGERGYYVPVGHAEGEQLPLEQVIDALRPAMTNPAIPKYAHNATYDLTVMTRYGIEVTPITFDTMVAEFLRDPASPNLGLKNLVRARFGKRMTEIQSLIGTGKKQITMDQVSITSAGTYAAADAAFTHQLVPVLREDIAKTNVLQLMNELEMPLAPVIARMERAGVLLDTAYLEQLSAQLNQQIDSLVTRMRAISNKPGLNPNSPIQLSKLLFEDLGIKTEGLPKTSSGYSTAAHVLESLRNEHEIVPLLLDFRTLSKLQGTYVDALPTLINSRTGRVHTSFNQTGSANGRLSSSNPNLQNIPIRTELGRDVRRAFIAAPGCVLLSVDYSQVELRIMAHMAKETALIEAFQQGQDIHATTAAFIYNVPLDKVTKEQRIFAKRVNFGVMYGMGAFRLARDSNLTFQEARDFIDTYFKRLPNVERYLTETLELTRERGYTETLFGRRRYFPLLQSNRGNKRSNDVQTAEREAINMPIQGTAADIIKKAMIVVDDRLREREMGTRMLLQVHDELLLEVPERELEEAATLVVDAMEGVIRLEAPLEANAQFGMNWLDLESVKRQQSLTDR